MKKRFYTLLFALVAMVTIANAQVVFDETNFPDPNFRAALIEQFWLIEYSHNSDGECISDSRDIREGDILYNDGFYDERGHFHHGRNYMYRKSIFSGGEFYSFLIDIQSKSITDLTGIEFFTILQYLECNDNQITSLDLSKNTALTALYCGGNQLTSLDLSKNTALTYLSCGQNQLTSLDVSGCTALSLLSCDANQLTSLDVSHNTALTDLYCRYNQLTSLDLSKNTALKFLNCYENQLSSLDVSGCAALSSFWCYGNQLTSLDVSQNTALNDLECHGNQLTSLDVSKNTALKYLYCFNNQIKGEEMDALVASLPTVESGQFYVINTKDENESNVCTKAQVAVAKEKGWTVYDYNGSWGDSQEYEGSDEAILLDEENFPDDNFRNALSKFFDIPENYEITGDLISVTTKLDISNNKITNTIGIEHLTSLEELWCHCNIIAGEAMAKLIASLTNLNISEAKGLMLTEETNPRKGALYALDFTDENEQNVCTAEHVAAANAKGWTVYCKTSGGWQEYNGEIPTGINTVDSGELTDDSWYTIDGKKLAGEPKEKGIYIRNGKKVVK